MEEIEQFTRCKDCIFSIYRKIDIGDVYECHRKPPTVVDRMHTMFPTCKPDWWCAEGIRSEV